MSGKLVLKKLNSDEYNKDDCIICQKSGKTVSTENGRSNIMKAATIRNDDVLARINSIERDQPFSYHMDNQCYKRYTLKKTLEKLVQVIIHFKALFHSS